MADMIQWEDTWVAYTFELSPSFRQYRTAGKRFNITFW